jgi:PAS domain S-box-containing protein
MSNDLKPAQSGRVLIVDDDTGDLQLLANLLEKHGYTAHPASTGELALKFVQTTLPDLVLLDIRMPGMDGFEVCGRLKADERTASIPVIFLTVLEDEATKVKGFEAGGVDYITKPFHPEEVLARVKTHLRLRELTERLERTVNERTKELMMANERLQEEIIGHRRAEKDLRESEAKYRLIVDTATESIWVFGPDFMTTFVNTRMADMLGYAAEEMIGRPMTDFMFEEDTPDYNRRMERRVQGIAENYERRLRCRDGKSVRTRVSATPVFDDRHHYMGSFGMFSDVTELKQAEEELRRLNQELEQRVRQRTGELEKKNAELEQMNKLFVGRELRMIELKEAMKKLESKVAFLKKQSGRGGP